MSEALLESLETHEAEIVAILSPLYAEVIHWENELAATRKAKRTIAARRARASTPPPLGV
jgi:hypothetical protein